MKYEERFTRAQLQEICRRYSAGEGSGVLAKEFGASAAGFRKLLRRLEIEIRPRPTNTLSTTQAQEAVARYLQGEGTRVLGKSLGASPDAIGRAVRKAGFDLRPQEKSNARLTDARKGEILSSYSGGKSSNILAKEFDVSKHSVLALLERNGQERRSASASQELRLRKYTCNHSFFQNIDTEEKAYWLGFITADGNVYKRTVSIGLCYIDTSHIEWFCESLSSTHPIKFWPRGESSIGEQKLYGLPCASVQINSLQLSNDLKRLGVHEAKSLTVKWAEIPDHLYQHYLRGLTDGDGCLYAGAQPTYSLIGTFDICYNAQTLLMRHCGLKRTKIGQIGKSFVLRYGGRQQVKRIVRFLYRGSTICLSRKMERAAAIITGSVSVG